MGKINPPEPLQDSHQLKDFDCGVTVLNTWLTKQALKNEQSGASRSYVVCHNNQVIGYYALSTGSVEHTGLPGKLRRNMPDPIPVLVLGRLAVDKNWQTHHIGRGLLKDAVLRACMVAEHVGVSALLVHSISEQAKRYYLQHGFIESSIDPMTLLLRLKDALATFKDIKHSNHC